MTTFCPQQSDRGRHARRKTDTNVLEFRLTNWANKLHGQIHEARKIVSNNFQRAAQECVMEMLLFAKQALPLNFVRFLRLAKNSPMVAQSPARWSRDGRETSGKKSGEMSRGNAAQFPGNSQAMANAMPPNIRQDDSQDNLPCTELGRAMSAPETCEITRNVAAQWSRNSRCNILQATCRILAVSFNQNIQKL